MHPAGPDWRRTLVLTPPPCLPIPGSKGPISLVPNRTQPLPISTTTPPWLLLRSPLVSTARCRHACACPSPAGGPMGSSVCILGNVVQSLRAMGCLRWPIGCWQCLMHLRKCSSDAGGAFRGRARASAPWREPMGSRRCREASWEI